MSKKPFTPRTRNECMIAYLRICDENEELQKNLSEAQRVVAAVEALSAHQGSLMWLLHDGKHHLDLFLHDRTPPAHVDNAGLTGCAALLDACEAAGILGESPAIPMPGDPEPEEMQARYNAAMEFMEGLREDQESDGERG